MDDDAPIFIAQAAPPPQKPKITRDAQGKWIVKFPDGRTIPCPDHKVPERARQAAAETDRKRAEQQRAQAAQQQRNKVPGIEKRQLRDDTAPRKKRAKSVGSKSSLRRTETNDSDAERDDAAAQAKMRAMKANRNPKDQMIADFLSRWWYVWPEYPPRHHDYGPELKKKGLRLVDVEFWEDEPKESKGLQKAYELSTFPGNFRDAEGHLHDLRPQVDKPSYNYLDQMSPAQIAKLLVEAYTNQIVELKKSPYLKILPVECNTNALEMKIQRLKGMAASA